MNASSTMVPFLVAAMTAASPSFARIESFSPAPQRFVVTVPHGASTQLSHIGNGKYYLSTSRPAGQDLQEYGARQQRYEIRTFDCGMRQTGVTSNGKPHFAYTCK